MYKIIKGLPASFAVFIKNNDEYVDLNDGSWDVDIQLKLNTADGPSVEGLDVSESGNGYIVALTSEQTGTLDHRSINYLLVVKASTTDQLTNLRSVVKVIVQNDI